MGVSEFQKNRKKKPSPMKRNPTEEEDYFQELHWGVWKMPKRGKGELSYRLLI